MNCIVQTIDTPRCADQHWVKNVHFQSFSGPYFPAVRLNTDIYSVNLHIQSGCRKIRTNNSKYGHFSRSASVLKYGLKARKGFNFWFLEKGLLQL